MLIDFTEQPNQMSQPALPAIAPPPPAVKPPTLATQIVQGVETDKRLTAMEQSLRVTMIAIGLIALVLLVVATELGVLIGQGR